MKKIYIILIAACTVFVSCKDDEGPSFYRDLEAGWVQFTSASSTEIGLDDNVAQIEIPLFLQTTTNIDGIDISYDLVSVSGTSPNSVVNGSNVVNIAPGTLEGSLVLTVNNSAVLSEPAVFDVILSGTSRNNVRVGLSDGSKPITHRVSICPSLDASTGAFIGDYILTVPTGAGPFGDQFEDGITVTVSEGAGGAFTRTFQADYLPAIGAGFPVVDINFSFVGGQIIIEDGVGTGLGCSSQIFLGGNSGNILSTPCGDASISLNMLDFQGGSGGCGVGDVAMTILLTKV
ncbi:MAG: hypothetical protein KJP09_04415 [Bacteroidia bacterium]|nr:hypothetical protein [Bacteroidia bacterium]NND09739.1 hypothetical protein [Flavobacteriaceae bacterium]MBT8310086.1 hypothetical protein [Bacteroidia bacterium]NNK27126.1 hypothetical protein [Flavobacteriaceae bacterium]NNL61884.1 hypothetical protein [Flavobacteriaceae bacterium]